MKTKSEALFEGFLTANNLPFEKIEEKDNTRTPDYRVSIGSGEIIFEVKELSEDENFAVVKDPAHPHVKSHSRILGDHIRDRIKWSKTQIQFGRSQGIPSVLLIYNDIDPIQIFGTEPMDFTSAMYGAYTIVLNEETRTSSDWFNGKGQMLQENVNTSFSAVGHLCDRDGKTTVTLYENVFAKVKVPYSGLPACFDVPRIEVSRNPLVVP
jgi:hypothetical protein